MPALIIKLLDFLTRVWRCVTDPIHAVIESEDRRRAQLLSSVLMAMALFVCIFLPLRYLSQGPSVDLPLRIAIAVVSGGTLFLAAQISRRGHTKAAAVVALLLGTLAVFFTTASVEQAGVNTLYYLMVLILFTSLFFSALTTTVIYGLYLIGMLLLPVVARSVTYQALVHGPLSFITLMTVSTLVFTYFRDQLDVLRQQRLSESEARYRTLFSGIDDAIFVHDAAGSLLDVNAAACDRLGYTRAELLSMRLTDLSAPDFAQHFLEQLQAHLREGGPDHIDGVYFTKDGRQIFVDINSKAIRYHDQPAILSVSRDITERRRLERQALDLNVEKEKMRVMTEFITAASHDFRTPLSVINTSLYLLGKSSNPQHQAHHIDKLVQQSAAIERLVDGLLTMARLDGAESFMFGSVNLNGLIREIETQKRPACEAKSLQVTYDLDPTLPVIEGDSRWLHLALLKLIENAIMFTPEGKSFAVETRCQGDSAVVTVSDTGIGIREHDLAHIFDRLYRGEKNRPVGGQGLGLPIACRIVERHHGRIEVESAVDVGSTFRVILPLVQPVPHAE